MISSVSPISQSQLPTTQPGGASQPLRGEESRAQAGSTENTRANQESNQAQELRKVQKLSQRDREVRAHEQAHLSAAGRFARSGTSFEFQRGPDGRLYAVGGEVKIDTSPVADDPQATLEKAEIVRRAALAPRDPSPVDHQVAARASAMAARARAELARANAGGEDGGQTLGNLIDATGATLQEPAPASVDELV